jgi:aspartate-semialdehyde dehydrogenase
VAELSQICAQQFPETKKVWAQAEADFRLKGDVPLIVATGGGW